VVHSPPTFIAFADLERLAAYLEDHVKGLQNDPTRDSGPFVPLGLGFQVQALSGEVSSPSDGELTLRVLVQVGENPRDGGRVYAGAEACVDVAYVTAFAASLRAYVANTKPSQPPCAHVD
jgi:hypothetical protein